MNAADKWEVVKKNKSYFHGALTEEVGLRIKWHSPASQHSSQIVCASIFGALGDLTERHAILSRLFQTALDGFHSEGEQWEIVPEATNPSLLSETGAGMPTNIDVLCTTKAKQAAITVEAKFLADAQEGFGGCSQWKLSRPKGASVWKRSCAGFFGPGSDLKTGSTKPCRLSTNDGKRVARRYWEVATDFFQQEALANQAAGQKCPFRGSNFQLMRNFLFAAETARVRDLIFFGVVAVVPELASETVREQVLEFQNHILKPSYRSHIGVLTCETIRDTLSVHGNKEAHRLAEHITKLLEMIA